jgi:subtilisin family serine protease
VIVRGMLFSVLVLLFPGIGHAEAPAGPPPGNGGDRAIRFSVEGATSEVSTVKTAHAGDNISGPIRAALLSQALDEFAADAGGGPTGLVRINPAGEVQVYVDLVEFRSEYVAVLQSHGLRVEVVLPEFRLVQGWLPMSAVPTVAGFDFVRQVREPDYARPNASGAANTEGDALLRADAARATFRVTGAGVRVGVISDGVRDLADSQRSGDLPSSVQVLRAGSGNEGTAMLEIVYDIAPGAPLSFWGVSTSVEMVQGINALRNAGARVIVDDVSFLGEPKFQDGMVAQTIRAFAQAGGIYVGAAGNFSKQHYRATYVRTTGAPPGWAGTHNYLPADRDIGNTVLVPPHCSLVVALQWNNPSGAARDDFDLFIARSSDGATVAFSVTVQDGRQNPFEAAAWTNNGTAAVAVFIAVAEFARRTGTDNVLDYFALLTCASAAQDFLQYATPAQSLSGNHAITEMLAVAALGADTPATAQAYSSLGPHDIFFPAFESRQVPHVSAIDCVQTRTGQLGHFSNPFCGTSAAAPHVAGIAALLMEAAQGLGAQQARDILMTTAIDLGAPGFDFTFGAGRIDAFKALSAVRGLDVFVEGFYEDVLGRQAEAAGRAGWVAFLQANCNPDGFSGMGVAFFDSEEFRGRPLTLQAVVTALYRAFLDRDPDPAGAAYWIQQLRSQRIALATGGFLPSPEFRNLLPNRTDRGAVTAVVNRFYTQILGRSAATAEVNGWVDYIVTSGDLEGAAIAFITSPEFEARPLTFRGYVAVLYRALLGREASAGEVASWEGSLRSHLVGVITTGFVPSPEFQAKAAQLCGT